MASMLPPPVRPGYSLRVQLFAPTAYTSNDKPLRSFRVVTEPDNTIREFCEDASRRHEGMYGTAFAVKRCQDDQGFDLMQTDILSSLFTNGATIRIVQAHALPNVRDSVPPTSALRFEPASLSGRKRDRPDSSPKTNGNLPPSSYKPNKRQRVADFDPDRPLPSLEEEPVQNGVLSDIHVVPNSQESVDLGIHATVRSRVRPDFLRSVAETPPPAPSSSAGSSADTFRDKYVGKRTNFQKEIQESSPVSVREMRARSGSLKAQRVVEKKGTASILPPRMSSAGTQPAPTNGPASGSTNGEIERTAKPRRTSGGKATSEKEDIYDQMPGDEGAAILKAKKAELSKLKNIPTNGRFNTPPSAQRHSRDHSTPGELPLTPNSRKEVQRQKREAEETKKARLAAAEAAEQRRREALEVQKLTKEKNEAEEQKRIEKEKLEREREEREEREAEERRIAEGLATAQRLLSPDGEIEPPEQQNSEKEKAGLKKRAAKMEANSTEKVMSTSPVETRPRKLSSPILPRPSSALSATPFIPTGRKSALKPSPVRKDASPALLSPSFVGVGIDQNMPLPKRKVSFHGVPDDDDSPSLPVVQVRNPVTPHPVAGKKKSAATKETTPKAVSDSASRKSKSITPDVGKSKAMTPQPSVKKASTFATLDTTNAMPAPEKSKSKSSTPSASNKSVTPQPGSTSKITAQAKVDPKTTVSVVIEPRSKNTTPGMPPVRPAAASNPILPVTRSSTGAIVPGARPKVVPGSEPAWKRVIRERDESESKSRTSSPQVQLRAYPGKQQSPASGKPIAKTTPVVHIQNRGSLTSSILKAKSKSFSAEPEPQAAKEGESSTDSESDSESESEVEKEKTAKSPKMTNEASKMIGFAEEIIPQSSLASPKLTRSSSLQQSIGEAEIETQSNNSSVRDSRSPVVYNQQDEDAQTPVQGTQKSVLKPIQAVEKSDDDSDSSSDEEMELSEVKPTIGNAQTNAEGADEDIQMPDISLPVDAQESSDSDTDSSSSTSSSDDDENQLPAPLTLKPTFPVKTALKGILSPSPQGQPSNSKTTHVSYISPSGSADTQEEVDFQLISSLNEAAPSSSASLAAVRKSGDKGNIFNGNGETLRVNGTGNVAEQSFSSPLQQQKRPTIGFGASLMGMNARKLAPSSSAPVLGVKAKVLNGNNKLGVKLKKAGKGSGSEEESEEEEDESDDDSDDSSDDSDKGTSKINSKLGGKPLLTGGRGKHNISSQKAAVEDDSDSDSDSDSSSGSERDSDSESEDEASRVRRRLIAEVEGFAMSQGAQIPSSSQSPSLRRKPAKFGLKR